MIAPLPQSIASPRIEDTVSRTASSNVAPPGGADDVDATRLLNGTDDECELYRHFRIDLDTAERQWDHPSTRQGMARLREREPLLQPTFLRCLAIARRTMNEDIVHEWREFQEQGWERRRQHGFGLERPATATPRASLPAIEPARRDVVAEAYRQFKEATGASTNSWKVRFQYRRAAIRLSVQYSTRLTPTSALGSPPVGRACRNMTAACYSAPYSERSAPSSATPCPTAPPKSKSRIRGTHTNGGLSIRPSKTENAGTSSPEISVLGLCSSLTRPGASTTSNSRSPSPSSPPGLG